MSETLSIGSIKGLGVDGPNFLSFRGEPPLGMAELVQASFDILLVVGSSLPTKIVTGEGSC